MATNFGTMIKKLQQACNSKYDAKLLINRAQIYSDKAKKPITIISVKKAIYDEKTEKMKNIEIFNTTSEKDVVFFMRDYWYELNGWEVPKDNEEWERAKEKYNLRKKKGISIANELP